MAGERGRHFMATAMGYGIVDEQRRVAYGDAVPAPVGGDGGLQEGDTESQGVDENKNVGENGESSEDESNDGLNDESNDGLNDGSETESEEN